MNYKIMTIILKYLSIGLALIAVFICLTLFGEHYGFEQGWNLAGDFWNKRTPDSPTFSIGTGPTTYGFLSERYFYIGFILIVYIIGEFITKKPTSKLTCLISLALIFYHLWDIYNWYKLLIETFPHYSVDSYFSLIDQSIPFVWIIFLISASLLTIQTIKLFTLTDSSPEPQEKKTFYNQTIVIKRYSRGISPGPLTVPVRKSVAIIIIKKSNFQADCITTRWLDCTCYKRCYVDMK